MGLFSKKCAACNRKLPKKRKYKGVCSFCGGHVNNYSKQLRETIEIIEQRKSPKTCIDRCFLGLSLIDKIEPYAVKSLLGYQDGMTYEERKEYFVNKIDELIPDIRAQNEKRQYSRKVGVTRYRDRNPYRKNAPVVSDGVCSACRCEASLNQAGYCYDCISYATSVTQGECMAYMTANGLDATSSITNDIIIAVIDINLRKAIETEKANNAKVNK